MNQQEKPKVTIDQIAIKVSKLRGYPASDLDELFGSVTVPTDIVAELEKRRHRQRLSKELRQAEKMVENLDSVLELALTGDEEALKEYLRNLGEASEKVQARLLTLEAHRWAESGEGRFLLSDEADTPERYKLLLKRAVNEALGTDADDRQTSLDLDDRTDVELYFGQKLLAALKLKVGEWREML